MVRLRQVEFFNHSIRFIKFQSHYGAIATRENPESKARRIEFQSHYGAIATFQRALYQAWARFVSIPLWCDCDVYVLALEVLNYRCFNPTMVRLRRTGLRWGLQLRRRSFNPTMVRLRPLRPNRKLSCTSTFQSHYGAIATPPMQAIHRSPICFNPTMVRLRLTCTLRTSHPEGKFQSHYGAIATKEAHARIRGIEQFQSHYGAIATGNAFSYSLNLPFVSIPLWCDCDLLDAFLHPASHNVSIPLWCDCDLRTRK